MLLTPGNCLLDHMDMAMVDIVEFRWLMAVCKFLKLLLTPGNCLLDQLAMVDMEFPWLMVMFKSLRIFQDQVMDMDLLRHLVIITEHVRGSNTNVWHP